MTNPSHSPSSPTLGSIERIRTASHAGSWYSNDAHALDQQLSSFLNAVRTSSLSFPNLSLGSNPSLLPPGLNSLPYQYPVPNARVILAPHAGYTYSGATAAYAYATWDITDIERVIILGPSHHVPLMGCALSKCTSLSTPLGILPSDIITTQRLADSGHFTWMTIQVDEAEHSLEMHFPYIVKVFQDASLPLPFVTQILVGDLTPELDRIYGDLIARELANPNCALIISTDFCHWGSRFRYTHYTPIPTPICSCSHPRAHHHYHDVAHSSSITLPWSTTSTTTSSITATQTVEMAGWSPRNHVTLPAPKSAVNQLGKLTDATNTLLNTPNAVPIHKSIQALDYQAMHLIERLDVPGWSIYLQDTHNTICGRNPIRILLVILNDLYEASLDILNSSSFPDDTNPLTSTSMALPIKPSLDEQIPLVTTGHIPVLRFLIYNQSLPCIKPNDSSVSYASAIAILPLYLDRILSVNDDDFMSVIDTEKEILRGDDDENMSTPRDTESEFDTEGEFFIPDSTDNDDSNDNNNDDEENDEDV